MDMTDLKAAIDDYSYAAEHRIHDLQERLDHMETKMARPGSHPDLYYGSDDFEHKDAFIRGFMQKGDETSLRLYEQKALSTSTGGDGGFAVPSVIDSEIERQLRTLSPLRTLVRVKTIDTANFSRLVSTGGAESGWVGDGAADGSSTRAGTATPGLKKVEIEPGEIYANASATQRALDDMQFDVEAWLQEEVAEEFAVKEGAAIINGNGDNRPKGFLHADYASSITTLKTGTDGGFTDADVLVDVVHALKPRYRKGASFVMNSETLAAVRKLKDADGNFLWRAGLTQDQPDMLLGYPVVEAEDMPNMAAGSLSIAFGNFERAYTLVERHGVRVLRDPYSNKPYVNFYATKRVGGALVNEEALALIQFAA